MPRDRKVLVEQVWPGIRGRTGATAGEPHARLPPLALTPSVDVCDLEGGEANLNGKMV